MRRGDWSAELLQDALTLALHLLAPDHLLKHAELLLLLLPPLQLRHTLPLRLQLLFLSLVTLECRLLITLKTQTHTHTHTHKDRVIVQLTHMEEWYNCLPSAEM